MVRVLCIGVPSFASVLAFVAVTSYWSGYGKAQREYVADPISFSIKADSDYPALVEEIRIAEKKLSK